LFSYSHFSVISITLPPPLTPVTPFSFQGPAATSVLLPPHGLAPTSEPESYSLFFIFIFRNVNLFFSLLSATEYGSANLSVFMIYDVDKPPICFPKTPLSQQFQLQALSTLTTLSTTSPYSLRASLFRLIHLAFRVACRMRFPFALGPLDLECVSLLIRGGQIFDAGLLFFFRHNQRPSPFFLRRLPYSSRPPLLPVIPPVASQSFTYVPSLFVRPGRKSLLWKPPLTCKGFADFSFFKCLVSTLNED